MYAYTKYAYPEQQQESKWYANKFIIFVYMRKEHGTTAHVAAYKQQTLTKLD